MADLLHCYFLPPFCASFAVDNKTSTYVSFAKCQEKPNPQVCGDLILGNRSWLLSWGRGGHWLCRISCYCEDRFLLSCHLSNVSVEFYCRHYVSIFSDPKRTSSWSPPFECSCHIFQTTCLQQPKWMERMQWWENDLFLSWMVIMTS